MSNNPRGRAVIINNKYFYDEEHHRHGTDHDKEKLQELFRKLYFDTITHDNLTAEVRTIQLVWIMQCKLNKYAYYYL